MMNGSKVILLWMMFLAKESFAFQINEAEERQSTVEDQRLFDQDPNYPQNIHEGESNYAEDYNDINYDHESIDRISLKQASSSSKEATKSTPALSALTLLGFLYFLGYIQDVLQGTSTRRKRDAAGDTDGNQGIESYLKSIEEVIDSIQSYIPIIETESETNHPNRKFIKQARSMDLEKSGRKVNDKESLDEKGEERSMEEKSQESGRTLEERADRIVSFLSSFLGKIPRLFGFSRKSTARNDYDISNHGSDTADPGFWSMFGSKVGQIATLMDFIEDPSPSRIGKRNREVERDDIEDEQLIAQPSELNAEDRSYLAPLEDSEEDHYLVRRKRFTEGMNSWYSEAAHGRLSSSEGVGADGQILKMVFNLFKGALTT